MHRPKSFISIRALVATGTLFLAGASFAQDSSNLWRDIAADSAGRPTSSRKIAGSNHRVLGVDRAGLAALLETAPLESVGQARTQGIVMELPMPRGGFQRFRIEESPIMEPALAAQFPDIKTYKAQGIDDPTATGRLDLTPQGFHAMIIGADETVFIDPYSRENTGTYVSYLKQDFSKVGGEPFKCEVHGTSHPISERQAKGLPRAANGTTLRTYRLAVAATGEYTAFHGGTVAGAQAAIVTTVARNTGIYERELAVRFTLVSAPSVIFTDAATDPFVNKSADIDKNTGVLNNAIGAAAYDIGHVFQNAPGGVAYLGSVCRVEEEQGKGGGVTGTSSPMGDPFDVDYVAHELGHQFAGNHSFNGTADACSTRNAGTAAEVGSGSTIQAYAGICGVENLQKNTDDMFHSVSLDEMQAFITTGGGNTCGTATATGNTPPTVSVGAAAYTIPKGTPFKLTATGSDVNGDSLTYSWEDRSLGLLSTDAASAQTDDGTRPLFRAFRPTTSGTRLFPKLSDILGTTVAAPPYINGETLPNTNRTLLFHVTARDNRASGGGTNDANTTITVTTTSGPFKVTSFATAATVTGATDQTVTWDVASTTAAPVSCANVAIAFSTDRGVNFTTLVASTANDGTESVTIPNTATTQGRVRVECVGNIFFHISQADLTVTANVNLPPTVASPASSAVTPTTATLSANAADNGSPITERGFVYSLTSANTNPAIGGTGVTKVVVAGSTGAFTTALTGLTSGVAYSFKGYAINANGTSYTSVASFSTPALRLSVNDVSANEGNSGTSTFTFSISLNGAIGQTVTVNYATADGTAAAGSDYTAASGTATINAGQTSTTFTVTVNGDTSLESNESFGVVLSNAVNVTIGRGVGVGVIKDDDKTPTANAPARPQPVFHEFFAVDTLETPYVGDFNGDLKSDIITFTRQNPSAIGDVYVATSTGATFGTNTKWHDFFAITTDETVVIGDYDGDGKDDIATWLGKTSRQIYVAKSTGTGMTSETVWLNSIGSAASDYLTSGDATGDGKDDLIMFARTEGKVYVAVSNGSAFGAATVWHPFFAVSTFERPRAADVNGDGKADIVTFATDSPSAFGDVYTALSNGAAFRDASGGQNSDKWHDHFAIRPTEEIRIGDLNGDRREDFFTFLPPPFAQVYTVFSQGTSMAENVEWPEKVAPLLGVGDTVYTGDVNGDGKADIIIFAQKEGKVFVSLTP